jgi:hypothetical protein
LAEAGELDGEHGLLSDQQHAGLGERGADLREDEIVERVRAAVALAAAAVFPTGQLPCTLYDSLTGWSGVGRCYVR